MTNAEVFDLFEKDVYSSNYYEELPEYWEVVHEGDFIYNEISDELEQLIVFEYELEERCVHMALLNCWRDYDGYRHHVVVGPVRLVTKLVEVWE